MSNIYKCLILLLFILIAFIGYKVKNDLNKDNNMLHLIEQKDDSVFEKKELKSESEQQIVQSLSSANLSETELENIKQTNRFLKFKQRIEYILGQEKPKLTLEEFKALMDEVDRLREQDFFFLAEAYMIRMELLKTQYEGEELNKKKEQMLEEMYRIDASVRAKFDPTSDKKFQEFKEQEARIIKKAENMDVYPNGLNKNQYIEQEINKIY